MRNFKTEGIIIRRRNTGESDRMITVFTREHGKLQFIAKGVRKITSHRSPHVEMLNHSLITAQKTKYSPVITEASVLNDFYEIKKDLDKVGMSYHLCELIDGLCPEGVEYEEIFDKFRETLISVSDSVDIIPVIHQFEVKLLTILGYWHGNTLESVKLDTGSFIENIIERRLKSKSIFLKLN